MTRESKWRKRLKELAGIDSTVVIFIGEYSVPSSFPSSLQSTMGEPSPALPDGATHNTDAEVGILEQAFCSLQYH